MAESLTTEIIRDGRLDLRLNQRERFLWEFEVQNSDGTSLNLAGSTIELFIKPLDLGKEPTINLTSAITDTETGPINVSLIPTTFSDKGFVKIDREVIRYDERTATQLDALSRAEDETEANNHVANSTVVLAGRVIDKNGSSNEKLILDEANGKISVYISQATLNSFRWAKAEYRLQMIDSAGDPEPLVSGFAVFEKRWAQ